MSVSTYKLRTVAGTGSNIRADSQRYVSGSEVQPHWLLLHFRCLPAVSQCDSRGKSVGGAGAGHRRQVGSVRQLQPLVSGDVRDLPHFAAHRGARDDVDARQIRLRVVAVPHATGEQ